MLLSGVSRGTITVVLLSLRLTSATLVIVFAPYPLAIETGRREVFPIDAKLLRWFEGGQIGGTPIFAKHSGSVAADPFVGPSIDTTITDIEEIVSEELKKVF